MITMAQSKQPFEGIVTFVICMRRGVPDIIKHYIWIKANNADRFYMNHSNFYKHAFKATFGAAFSGFSLTFWERRRRPVTWILIAKALVRSCPFCAFIGAESFYNSDHAKSDLGDEYNYWGRNSLDTASTRGSMFRSSSLRSRSKTKVSNQMYHTANLPLDQKQVPQNNNNMRPDVILEDEEVSQKSLGEYLTNLHKEHLVQNRMIRSTMAEIRQTPSQINRVYRDYDKYRQLSDTFLIYKHNFPPPPTHHEKLVGARMNSFDLLKKPVNIKPPPWRRLFSRKSKGTISSLWQRFVLALIARLRFKNLVGFCKRRCSSRQYTNEPRSLVNVEDLEKEAEDPSENTEPTLELTNVNLSRHVKSKAFGSSVYKLTDVIEFSILLAPEGIVEVKRMLWCLNCTFGSHVEFLPIIPSLCCLLVIYMAPDAAFCVLHCLLNRAVDSMDKDCGQRFLFCTRSGFVVLVKYVLGVSRRAMKKLVAHLQFLNVDLAAWIARAVQYGFSHMLPFDYIVRIYGNLLFEGEEVFCRYCLAILKACQPTLLKCATRTEAETCLYRIGLDQKLNIDEVTKVAYSFRLRQINEKYKNSNAPSPYLMPVKIKTFYRPRLAGSSLVFPDHAWESLWGWIAPAYRILDPIRTFSTQADGSGLIALVKRLREFKKPCAPGLLFLSTQCGSILGCFIPQVLSEPNQGQYTSNSLVLQHDSFVFTMGPQEQVYKWSGKNSSGIHLSIDQIMVGGNGPALIISKRFDRGYSAECASYNSPQLTALQYFDILVAELWLLI
ncbi:bifunctional TLDc domain/Rab-GTPase-TBC domain superfamily/Rab-GTPase-TBC domain [Babesia duncani]|uniref:Bifunctional TLDc domain/Rab-GTPase-TBC domain superfamily/Rab-GTPase-TBC domain n=1 Tax=Babesia duncani TaxID=323732 RepID=A0AAD9UQY8_9APIC|nr:bifunctional TLDc domain/Rab-GTPase-TBC domain superfamily/Rab-GTPase-TBC domain [Babesia duncani]